MFRDTLNSDRTLQKGWSVKEAEFLKYVDDRAQWSKDLDELSTQILEQKKSFSADRRAVCTM